MLRFRFLIPSVNNEDLQKILKDTKNQIASAVERVSVMKTGASLPRTHKDNHIRILENQLFAPHGF